jgi:hypothetical protein
MLLISHCIARILLDEGTLWSQEGSSSCGFRDAVFEANHVPIQGIGFGVNTVSTIACKFGCHSLLFPQSRSQHRVEASQTHAIRIITCIVPHLYSTRDADYFESSILPARLFDHLFYLPK